MSCVLVALLLGALALGGAREREHDRRRRRAGRRVRQRDVHDHARARASSRARRRSPSGRSTARPARRRTTPARAGRSRFGSALLGGDPAPAGRDRDHAPTRSTSRARRSASCSRAPRSPTATASRRSPTTIPPPSLSVADSAAVTEGAAGAKARSSSRLSAPSGRDVVGRATPRPTASATAGQDYAARSGTLALPAGSTQATVDVARARRRDDEPAETFELRLVVAGRRDDRRRRTATATIVDDDEPPPPPPPADPSARDDDRQRPAVEPSTQPPATARPGDRQRRRRAARARPLEPAPEAAVDGPRHGLLPADGRPLQRAGHALQHREQALEA